MNKDTNVPGNGYWSMSSSGATPKICNKRENYVEYQVVEYCHFFKKYHALSIVIGCDEIVVSTIQHRRHVI